MGFIIEETSRSLLVQLSSSGPDDQIQNHSPGSATSSVFLIERHAPCRRFENKISAWH